MTDVVLNEGAIRHFLHDPTSQLGRHMGRLATRVNQHAHANVAPHTRSGDLASLLRVKGPFQDTDALYFLVGTDAAHPWRGHEPFNYPLALELGGVTPGGTPYHYPFLTPALIQVGFRQGA
jgi:hypothetical protein